MTSKFAIKSILAVSSVFMLSVLSPTASALVSSTTVSGCSLYKKSLGQCSVFVDGILKGLGNVNRNPIAFTARMSNISGKIFCKNPAGNSIEGQGVPFTEVPVNLAGADTINQAQVTKNGKALSGIVFHDPQIIDAIKVVLDVPPCQHSNWIQVIVVTKMQVMGQQLSDPTPNDPATCYLTPNLDPALGPVEDFNFVGCDTDDTLRVSCRIQDPYFDLPASAIGVKSYSYGDEETGTGACTEICHSTDENQCSANVPDYPAP